MYLWIKSSTSLVVLKYPLHLYHTQTNLQPAHYTVTGMIREDKSKKFKILPSFSPFVLRRVQYKSHLCTKENCIAIRTETQCPSQHLSYQ